MSVFSVGYTTKLVPNWDKFAPPIKAPTNYGPEAAAKYIERQKVTAQEDAKWEPLTARIDTICALRHANHTSKFEVISGIPRILNEFRAGVNRIYVYKPLTFTRMLMEAAIAFNNDSLHQQDRWLFRFETSGMPVHAKEDNVVIMDPVRAITGESDLAVAPMLERYTPRSGPGREICNKIQTILAGQVPASAAETAAHYMSFFGYMLEG